MATTSPDNLKSPDAGDQYALVQDLGVLASTTQTALNRRANFYTGTAAARQAWTTAPVGVHWQDTNSSQWEWVRKSTGWVVVNPSVGGTVTNVVITPSTITTFPVTFPSGLFTSPPSVMLTGNSPASRLRDAVIYASGVSASGFSLNVYGTGTGSWTGWSVDWLAVQSS